MDNTGKLYFFNEESNKCELLFNGKEFIVGNLSDGIYFLGTDNKVYSISIGGTEAPEFEITPCSDDKVMNYITSPFDGTSGFFGITKNGEICYSLKYEVIIN